MNDAHVRVSVPSRLCRELGRACVALLISVVLADVAHAEAPALPDPLRMDDAVRYARQNRPEVLAARQSAAAASFWPEIVSALPDPVASTSLDHLPFALHGADGSLTLEQSFPLSRERGHRERAARARASFRAATTERVSLDVELEAMQAFLMLHEVRRMREVAASQLQVARQLVSAAQARFSAARGAQTEVLRAETEVARFEAELRALDAEIAGATAMLNGALGRPPTAAVPALALPEMSSTPEAPDALVARAVAARPELGEGRAQLAQAEAEVDVMESMFAPMAMVRGGPAFTMSDGPGVMLMVGVSIPLWRGKLDAGVSEARAMVRMAEADLDAMSRMIAADVVAAHHRVAAAEARLDGVRTAVIPRARQTVDAALSSYGAGFINLVSVIDAAQALWSAQEQEVHAEVSLHLARASLLRAMGEGVETSP